MKLLRKNGQMPRTTTTSAMITVTVKEKHFQRPLVNDAYALTGRPANSLSKGECDTSCPKTPPTNAKEGSSGCKDLGCCGSTENSAVTVVQTIKISREQLGLKKHGKNPQTF